MDTSNSQNLSAGTKLGYYQIIEKIGSGGMGEVYLALDSKLNRQVAIKVLLSEYFDDADKIARFKREALTVASINHANIMSIYDIDEVELESKQKINFIVMEFIEGQLLDQYLMSKANRSISELLRIAEKLSTGLVAAHAKGVVHRDLKMGNIIINKDHVPKILDFGLAKPVDPISLNSKNNEITDDTESIVSDLTQEGKIVGTISYMSPEQARGAAVDLRSDIFSLGVLLYKMFTEKFPFIGADNVSIIAKILEAPHLPLLQANEKLPPELGRIIDKCLQKNPDNRYQDTRDLMLDLRNLRKQSDSGVSDSISGIYEYNHSKQKNRLQKTSSIIGSVAIALVLLLSIYFFGPFEFFNSTAMAKSKSLAILNFENLSDTSDKERYGQILQELLITDLSSSSQMKVVSSQRLFDIQKKLGYDDRNKIDKSIATEVAKESGATTMLSGNLINTGDEWLVTGQLIDVEKGTVIKSHRLKGTNLYSMVDSLSEYILSDLSVENEVTSNNPGEKKNQISMEAYQHYFTGIDYLGDADYTSAIGEFKKAITIDTDFSKAYYKLTIALWWQNDSEEQAATEELINLIKNRSYSSVHDELLVKASFALFEHDYVDAQIAYQELANVYPDDKEVWYGLGEALFHKNNDAKQEALVAFEKAIELDVTFVLAYSHIFDLYYRFDMFEKANSAAINLIKEKPESMVGYRNYAATSVILGDTLKIIESEKEALKYHTSEVQLLNLYKHLIQAYIQTNNHDKILSYYQTALSHNESNHTMEMLSIWGAMIQYYSVNNFEQEARAMFETAINSNVAFNQKINFISNRMQSHFENVHTRKKAHLVLKRGLELDSTNSSPLLNSVASQLYLIERDYDKAEYYARQALDLDNESMESNWAKNNLFSALLYNKKYTQAEKLAKEFIQVENNNAPNYQKLIQVYVNSNQFQKADSLVDYVLSTDTSTMSKNQFLYNVGLSYRNINQSDKAIALLKDALNFLPDDANTIEVLARTLINNHNFIEGEQYAQKLLNNDAQDEDGINLFVRSKLIQKDFSNAYKWISKIELTNSTNFRMHGYYHVMRGQYDSAYYYADSSFKTNKQFFSMNLFAWVNVAGEFDIDYGMQMAKDAIQSPMPYSPIDIYILSSPHVPLPEHTIGLGYLKKGDYANAKKYLDLAKSLRPNDELIQNDLKICIEKITN